MTHASEKAAGRADALLALFAREGYRRIEPSVLQPVDVFLDLSGEDIRRHMFLTQDADGNELCLRPDYTIPVSRDYLAEREAGGVASFSYLGPVFRQRAGRAGEFPQGGVESFGRLDREAADAEIVALGFEALTGLGVAQPSVRMGDIGLLNALLDALAVSPLQRRRILRAVSEGRAPDSGNGAGNPSAANHGGLLAALEGQDPTAARAFVEDVLSIAGISSVGGRSAGEIAERFLAHAADRNGGDLTAVQRGVLDRYLAIESDPDSAASAVRALAGDAGLDLDAALDSFEARTGFIAARGLDVGAITFAAGFARNLDYYTGFIVEMHDGARPDTRPILGGGRYDSLLTHLGAPGPVPAVGFAIWIDRFDPDSALDPNHAPGDAA
ncbi:ATP phosphoribosyltransferase regulatory subunit [Pseudochelatococcus lubricantis]|uniref:ATP phosphoribosyltransferase regulatory subunit n=1 Tax=Pseudochelatococcus lubricantis TaxID=1538102 RepID=A0ABX0V5Z9_9HYPH|nr:ATP phosphoribosyltransferase regulatory subunit [Pseudochelatococcus lubricantis]NIJ59529.1 ATP phosphoribosyltransferase regulatory subunit [Pseudochelatococcus lubricantis]